MTRASTGHHALPRHANDPGRPRVSVVMPTLNEAKNLPAVFEQMPHDIHEIIVIDGFSTDETVEVATRIDPRVRIVLQDRRGKGNALATGFDAVTGDVVVTLDADCSADPGEIERFVDALVGGADFAKGSRYLPEGGSDDLTWFRSFGNKFLSGTVNVLFGTSYTDLCYGYNAFWTHCLPYIELYCDGFEVETVMNIQVAQAGLTVTEVASWERLRVYGDSNLHPIRDGLRIERAIMRELFGKAGRGAAAKLAERRGHPRGAPVGSPEFERRACFRYGGVATAVS
jgi:glycosyltransferase involved in cell wall biosynthesis